MPPYLGLRSATAGILSVSSCTASVWEEVRLARTATAQVARITTIATWEKRGSKFFRWATKRSFSIQTPRRVSSRLSTPKAATAKSRTVKRITASVINMVTFVPLSANVSIVKTVSPLIDTRAMKCQLGERSIMEAIHWKMISFFNYFINYKFKLLLCSFWRGFWSRL